jgi:hypothetical protein
MCCRAPMLLLPRPLLSRTLASEQADEDRIRQACGDENVDRNKSIYIISFFQSLLQGIPRANVTTPMKRRRCVERPAAMFGDSCTPTVATSSVNGDAFKLPVVGNGQLHVGACNVGTNYKAVQAPHATRVVCLVPHTCPREWMLITLRSQPGPISAHRHRISVVAL